MQKKPIVAPAIFDRHQATSFTGLSLGTLRNLMARGEFPASFPLTGRGRVGWLALDIQAWVQARAEGKPLAPADAARVGAAA